MSKSLFKRVTARFRKNKLYSIALQLTGNTLQDKKWIIILGCYNSGTTLLDKLLSTHPEIAGLDEEGVMLTNQLPRPEDYGWRRMWFKCEENMKIDNSDVQKADVIKRHWSHFFDTQKHYLLEKSIANICRIQFFEENFDSPYFIHLVRNGYAVAEGIHRKAYVMKQNCHLGERYPMAYCAEQWTRSIQLVENSKGSLRHFIEVSYENLVNDTPATLNSIFAFIGLRKTNYQFENHNFKVHEKNSPVMNMNKTSFDSLTKDQINVISDIAGEKLHQYNYKIL